MHSIPVLNNPNKPLVSVLIFNYNYGRYLRQCFDSVIAQTYDNIEICFSDNASTDDSWDIALEYMQKYPEMMTITSNRKNFGPDANFANCWQNTRGKYFIEMCSDDALMSEYIEQCVRALEAHPNVGFALVHRTIIDKHGKSIEEPPFYNQSCIIPGPGQAAVYMMASVNPSVSQIMYNKNMIYGKSATGGFASRWYGTRIMDFNICCEHPIVYIKEPLLLHRLHSDNDSFRAADNLMEVIGPFVLQLQFAEIAANYGLKEVVERLQPSFDKIGKQCMRYCIRSLIDNNEKNAKRFFHLSIAVSPDVTNDPTYKTLQKYWESDSLGKSNIIESLRSVDNLVTRSVSYDPPPGSIPLDILSGEKSVYHK